MESAESDTGYFEIDAVFNGEPLALVDYTTRARRLCAV